MDEAQGETKVEQSTQLASQCMKLPSCVVIVAEKFGLAKGGEGNQNTTSVCDNILEHSELSSYVFPSCCCFTAKQMLEKAG